MSQFNDLKNSIHSSLPPLPNGNISHRSLRRTLNEDYAKPPPLPPLTSASRRSKYGLDIPEEPVSRPSSRRPSLTDNQTTVSNANQNFRKMVIFTFFRIYHHWVVDHRSNRGRSRQPLITTITALRGLFLHPIQWHHRLQPEQVLFENCTLPADPEVEEIVYQSCLGQNQVPCENYHHHRQDQKSNIILCHHRAMQKAWLLFLEGCATDHLLRLPVILNWNYHRGQPSYRQP